MRRAGSPRPPGMEMSTHTGQAELPHCPPQTEPGDPCWTPFSASLESVATGRPRP